MRNTQRPGGALRIGEAAERPLRSAIFYWMTPAEYRQQTDRCRRLAEGVDPVTRDRLLALAEHYEALARQAEANHHVA